MNKNNILPDIDLQNSREYYSVGNTRDFYKGKSFNFAKSWAPGVTYYNDNYIQDFVAYKGALLACHRSHVSSRDLEPILIVDPETKMPTGVDSSVWEFVFSGITGATGESGQVCVPEYNESTGIVKWIWKSEVEDVSPMHIKGDNGKDGINGSNGVDGKDGKVYIPNYDKESGYIVWSLSESESPVAPMLVKGEKGDPGPTGATGATGEPGPRGPEGCSGPRGPRGDRGPSGESATIQVIETITSDPGTKASVVNVGTSTNAQFKFSIPRGEQGLRGEQGPKGDTGDQGPEGPQGKHVKLYRDFTDDTIKWGHDGEPLSQWTVLCYMDYLRGVSVDDVDITDDAHLEITLSSGHYTWTPDENGNPIKDENGTIIYDRWIPDKIITKGKAATTVTIGKVETLDPNEEARIENVGTIKDPILDFYIPQGFTGEHAIHVGSEDPITFKNNNLDDKNIQKAYENAEEMIWVDTKETSEFDHLNSVYHGYLLAGGKLNFEDFSNAFANLNNLNGATSRFEIIFKNSFEDLGSPTKDKQGKLFMIPSTNSAQNDLFEEYIVIKDRDTIETYLWEKWGAERITVDLSNFYTKQEIDSQLLDIEKKIDDLTTLSNWNDII